MKTHKTEQEKFWAGEFGTEYIDRNKGENLLASNLNFLVNALKQAGIINNCIEFGANVGMNLRALKLLYPNIKLKGIEIHSSFQDIPPFTARRSQISQVLANLISNVE